MCNIAEFFPPKTDDFTKIFILTSRTFLFCRYLRIAPTTDDCYNKGRMPTDLGIKNIQKGKSCMNMKKNGYSSPLLMPQAQRLLLFGMVPIYLSLFRLLAEILHRAPFSEATAAYFGANFKKLKGTSPLKFRKETKER